MAAPLLDDDVRNYLEELRDSGEINMLGAGPFLEAEFRMTRHEARAVLRDWIDEQRGGKHE